MKTTHFFASVCLISIAGVLSAQTLSVSPASVTLNALTGTTSVVSSSSVNVSASSGNPQFVVQIIPSGGVLPSWLSLAASVTQTIYTGTAPGSFVLYANPTNLSAGTYTAAVTVSGGTVGATIPVTLTVSTISVSPQPPVQMTYIQGSGNFTSASLQLTSSQINQYTTQIPGTTACAWMSLTPTSGTVPGSGGSSTLAVLLNPDVVLNLTANTYTCTFNIVPSNSPNAAISVPVILTVTATPTVTVSPTAVNLNFQNGTTVYPSQVLTLTSNGSQAFPYSAGFASTDAGYTGLPWATVSPTSGTVPASGNSTTVTLTYNSAVALAPGTYHGQVTVTVNNSTQTIPVQLLVANSPLLNVSPSTLTFTSQLNGSIPAPATVTATATSGQLSISYSISYTSGNNWLFASVGTATSAGTPITVSVNPSGLALGTYKGVVAISAFGAANNPQNVSVTLNVSNDALITTNVSSSQPLIFPFQTGLTATAPPTQVVTVSSTTGATLSYKAVAAVDTLSGCTTGWLSVSGASSGNTAGSFSVSANPAGITPGSHGLTCSGDITITATNPITGNAAPNSPYVIPVLLYVSSNALLVVSPDSAPAFSAQVGGTASSAVAQNCISSGAANCTLTLTNTSPTDVLSVSVIPSTTDGSSWLYAVPNVASIPLNGSVSLTIGLVFVPSTAGAYTGKVTIVVTAASGATVLDSPVIIPVTLQVSAGTPTASPTSLTFAQTLGGSVPTSQTINVGSSTGLAVNFTAAATVSTSASWLTVSPSSGTTPATLTVTANGSQLAPSATAYQGQITISAAGSASTTTVPVSLTVSAGTISASPSSLTFSQVQNGTPPPVQTISVSGTPGAINFTTSETTATGGLWLGVSPASGSTPGTVSVSVNSSTLGPGQYTGSITITSTGATGSPITVPVTLTVQSPQTLSVTPSTLTFSAIANQPAPMAQTVSLGSSGSTSFTAAATAQGGGTWLSVSPTSGSTPGTLTVSVASQPLAAGTYTGTVTISSPNASPASTVNVTLTVVAVPTPVITAIKNAASYASGAIAPGENIVIGGTGIGPATLAGLQLTTSGAVATLVAGTQVTFDNIPAPIVYVSSTQTSVMVPFEISGRATTQVQVSYLGVPSLPLTYNVVQAQPGIYALNQAGSGPGAILNQNFTVNGPTNPAPKGSYVAIYMTGAGQTSPAGVTGGVAPNTATGQKMALLPVTATVGGIAVPATAVAYSGTAPGFVEGVVQVNLQIPATAVSGAGQLVVNFGAFSTQAGITVQVQ